MATPAAEEKARRNKCNNILGKICSKSHPSLDAPLKAIAEAITACGFSMEGGLYCGRKGDCKEKVGKNTWLVLQWYKLADHPNERWEVNAYVS